MRLKNKLFVGTLAFTLAATLLSCGGDKGNRSESDTELMTDSLNVTDSVSTNQQGDTTKKIQEKPERKFSGTSEELDFMRNSGHWEKYQNGIIPRMAEEVPQYAGKLLNNTHNYFIVVDKAAMKVLLYDKYGQLVKEYPCAASKNYGNKKRKGDARTAEGYFTAEGVYDSTDWLFTNDAGYTSPAKGQFGPRFIRLKGAPQIGIHGTAAPRSIGKRVSHGCVRLTNENILDLVKYAEAGMPIIVSPGPQDMRVNNQEGTPVPAVTTGATRVVPAESAPEKKQAITTNSTKQPASPQTETQQGKSESPATEETKATEESKETPATPVTPATPSEPTNGN